MFSTFLLLGLSFLSSISALPFGSKPAKPAKASSNKNGKTKSGFPVLTLVIILVIVAMLALCLFTFIMLKKRRARKAQKVSSPLQNTTPGYEIDYQGALNAAGRYYQTRNAS